AEGVRLPAAALLVAEKLPDSDPQKKVVVDYKKTYEAKTGHPVSTFGGHMYDGLMILVEAMKRAGGADKAKVRDEIEKTKNFMGTGGIVNMSPTDHMGLDLSAFRMLEIKNGDWTLVN
ncbi:ABC transporter substrate-binding protein, partial [bacterium]